MDYTKGKCKCQVDRYNILHRCPLHEAAPKLYEALKRIATKLESWGKGNLSVSEEYTLQEANQAIAKAESQA